MERVANLTDDGKMSEVESQSGRNSPFPEGTNRRGSLLEPLPAYKQVQLEFIQVSAYVQDLMKQIEGPKEAKKQILKNVSGCANPGETMALMGPSGSGKSTLLTILSGRHTGNITVEGSIRFNGSQMNEATRRKVAFVPQDDILYKNLTVFEILYYTAQLSMPKRMSTEAKTELVEEAILALGLGRCRNTPIRPGGSISGGERKRVCVASEMLTNPSLIFLDEPTSGLDSTAASVLVKILQDLAKIGRTVVCTIHQPNASIFSTFDSLMLLSKGESMYYGRRRCVTDWFSGVGVPCPYGVNISEHFIDVASCTATEGSDADPTDTRDNIVFAFNMWMDSSARHLAKGITPEDLELAPMLIKSAEKGARPDLPSKGEPLKPLVRDTSSDDEDEKAILRQMKEIDGLDWFSQFWLLYHRSVASRKFETLSVQKVVMIVGWSVVAGLLWIGNGYLETFQDIQNLSGLFWLLTLYQFSQGLLTSLWVFPPELPVVVKERGGGMYSLTAYYLSRSVSELQLEVPFVVLQVTIVYFMVVLRPQIAAYVLTLLAMILVSLTSQGIGQLIGIGVNSPKNVQLSSALTIQWTLMASGFLMVMPTWLVWTQYLSVIRFGYIALLFIQFQDNYYQVCPDNNIVEVNECQLVPWTVALGGPQQLRPRLWVDWLALGGFVIVSRLSCFFMLKYRAEGMFEAKRKP